MSATQTAMQDIEERFAAWAEGSDAIRAAFVIGSRARTDHPADEWSDLDIVVIADKPEDLLYHMDWLDQMGPHWITFIEPTVAGTGYERRVLFSGGHDVDFAVLSREQFDQLPEDLVRRVISRGMRVLLDKDGRLSGLSPDTSLKPSGPPTEEEYGNVVADFWYHAVWTARKLRRGEIFIAKRSCDEHMKALLLQMAVWQAGATRGWKYDTWHQGRFLEEWADPRALAQLKDAYAHYDAADIERALLATMALFRWLAPETFDAAGYAYPVEAEGHATRLVAAALDGTAGEVQAGTTPNVIPSSSSH